MTLTTVTWTSLAQSLRVIFTASVLWLASAPAVAQQPECDPNGCAAIPQTHFNGEWGMVWLSTPNPGSDEDGQCFTDCDTEECSFQGTLKVTNNTGFDRVVFCETGCGLNWSLPNNASKTFLYINLTSGCGVTPAKNYHTETTSGTWTSSFQFVCESCLPAPE